jgi:anti-sigma factor RsiW
VKHLNDLKERDLAKLSAYLDGELDPKEASRLEVRLKDDPQLLEVLSELDGTRKLVGSLPQIRPPRNFTLTPEMVGIHPQRSIFPVFRLATIVAAVAFAVLVGADTFFSFSKGMMGAPEAVSEAVEVTVVMEAEKVVEAPAAEEAPLEAAGEPEMEAAQDTLGVESPSASIAEVTEVFVEEGIEPTLTELPANKVELAPDATQPAPGEILPYTTPTLGAQRAVIETQPVSPSPQATTIPTLGREPGIPQKTVDPIRVAEVGVGVLAVILAVVTFILRKQR